MNDDIRSLRNQVDLLELKLMNLELHTSALKLTRDIAKGTAAQSSAKQTDALIRAAQLAAELGELLRTYVTKTVGCAACRPARRPENTQSASDNPLT